MIQQLPITVIQKSISDSRWSLFFDNYSTAYVYATGSTKARTRLYRIGISKYYEEMHNDFYLYGQVGDDFPESELNKDYDGFLAQRKF